MLSIENLSISFQNKRIFDNFTLKIGDKGKILIKGQSGIGKTTLFNYIMGFLKSDKGNLYFKNKKIIEGDFWDLRKNISYVPQNPDVFVGKVNNFLKELFSLKVNKKIQYSKKEIYKYFDFFELDNKITEENFAELSGGEKQRLLLVIAIMLNRKIFLLDEPTSALDTELKKKIADYFLNSDKTVLVISHDPQWESDKISSLIEVGK